MLISVVVPTFDRPESLRKILKALESQTHAAREIIIVDDGSSDETEATVRQFQGVKYLYQQNRGPAAARNTASREARGEIIALTDDDCMPPINWLEQIAQGYRSHPEIAGVGGPCRAPAEILESNLYAQYEWNYERGMLPSRHYIEWLTRGRLTWRGRWCGQGDYVGGMDCPSGRSNNISYRLSVFKALNGFDETFPFAAGEDADFKIRLCLAGHQLLWLDDMIVEHHHAYTSQRFRAQHFTYGRGVVHLERKYLGRPTPYWRAALRLLKRTARPLLTFLNNRERPFVWLKFQAEIYDALGQLAR